MKDISHPPDIFQYHDAIMFLRDWLEFLKKREIRFSMRDLSTKSGIAIGYLPMCFAGQRKLSSKAFSKIVPHLKLDKSQRKYLDWLFILSDTEDPERRSEALRQLQRYQTYREKNASEFEVHRYMSEWHYSAIREMAFLRGFRADAEWIQGQLKEKLPLKQIEEAMDFLIQHGFWKKGAGGKIQATEKQLSCTDGVYKISLGAFHRQMLGLAEKSIERDSREERLMMGHTMAIAERDREKVFDIIRDAISKLEKLGVDTKGPAEVFHCELAAFPLSASPRKRG